MRPERLGILSDVQRSFPQVAGMPLEWVPCGSTAALQVAARGDVDAALVDSHVDALAFVVHDRGRVKVPVWRKRIVLVGPPEDPAHVRGLTLQNALAAIGRARLPFVSLSDWSGLHRREQELWVQAGGPPSGRWYVAAGVGAPGALSLARQRHAYMLCDEAGTLAEAGIAPLTTLVVGTDDQAIAIDLVYDTSRQSQLATSPLALLVAALTRPGRPLPAGYLPATP